LPFVYKCETEPRKFCRLSEISLFINGYACRRPSKPMRKIAIAATPNGAITCNFRQRKLPVVTSQLKYFETSDRAPPDKLQSVGKESTPASKEIELFKYRDVNEWLPTEFPLQIFCKIRTTHPAMQARRRTRFENI
jgi:hypothetical protein